MASKFLGNFIRPLSGRKEEGPLHPVGEVRVSITAAQSEYPYDVPLEVDGFLRRLVEERLFYERELPEHSVNFRAALDYFGEVNNGGHAQYDGNTGGDEKTWRQAADFLRLIGEDERLAILEEFIAFTVRNRRKIDRMARSEEANDWELFVDIDDRFHALNRRKDDFYAVLKTWLLEQDWVVVDPAIIDPTGYDWVAIVPVHPLVEARLEEKYGKGYQTGEYARSRNEAAERARGKIVHKVPLN